MPQNEGKKFEEDFKKSVPKEYWLYRFRDGTGNFAGGKNENVRFQATNICDFEVVTNELVFLLELKSYKGASISFEGIRSNQINQMSEIDHKKIKAYFILNFREKEKTFAIEAKKLKEFMETTDRKSIPLQWCVDNGIQIIGEKKKVRFKYNLNNFFDEASKIS
jgi:recombination protein U